MFCNLLTVYIFFWFVCVYEVCGSNKNQVIFGISSDGKTIRLITPNEIHTVTHNEQIQNLRYVTVYGFLVPYNDTTLTETQNLNTDISLNVKLLSTVVDVLNVDIIQTPILATVSVYVIIILISICTLVFVCLFAVICIGSIINGGGMSNPISQLNDSNYQTAY